MKNEDPLLPGYNFDVHLVAGLTSIHEGMELDFEIDRPHGMKGYILNITTSGEGQIFSGKDAFSVKQGDLLLFPPDVVHFYQRHPDASSWDHRWIYFRPRGFWHELLNWHEVRHGVYITKNIRHFSKNNHELLADLFTQIEDYNKSKQVYSNELAFNLLEQLLIRCKCLQPEHALKNIDPRVLKAINFMMDNIQIDHTIEEISAVVFLSPSRLIHLFNQELGMSILNWRNDQRISYAKQLLLTSQAPINIISRNIGFSDPLYFSRVFKNCVGVSPKKFRQEFIVRPT